MSTSMALAHPTKVSSCLNFVPLTFTEQHEESHLAHLRRSDILGRWSRSKVKYRAGYSKYSVQPAQAPFPSHFLNSTPSPMAEKRVERHMDSFPALAQSACHNNSLPASQVVSLPYDFDGSPAFVSRRPLCTPFEPLNSPEDGRFAHSSNDFSYQSFVHPSSLILCFHSEPAITILTSSLPCR